MPIKINTLHSLEDVKDYYVITEDLKIVNTCTGYVKTLWLNHGGYPTVTLETNSSRNVNVVMHKIVALAFIENLKTYELIEHLNDIKTDYSVNNLMFSNHSNNGKRAFQNGLINRVERTYRVTMYDGTSYIGTMKELSKALGISRYTLYDNVYKDRVSRKFKKIELVDSEI